MFGRLKFFRCCFCVRLFKVMLIARALLRMSRTAFLRELTGMMDLQMESISWRVLGKDSQIS